MAKDETSKFHNSIIRKLDSQLWGLLFEISTKEDYIEKAGQSTIIRIAGLGSKRVILMGIKKVATNFSYRMSRDANGTGNPAIRGDPTRTKRGISALVGNGSGMELDFLTLNGDGYNGIRPI
ncbi:LOW QUALITY PROTEIN: hypothetical protein OSB04_un001114 [Centaurea solstitialis]|uniref:Uncharacterized protein n=1 Tax=Centaurea solstitialis TaxID=347529 RepID=A0AA38S4Y3_9ASTR|nr:LOW QUALITY PROTEIN: hypothetical protein OSB04_un001114 [Centaurea solstitialis]